MFSSSNAISPFSPVSPYLSWNPSTSSSFCLNENQALLYHHEDLLSYCFNVAPIIETANKLATVSTKKSTAPSTTTRTTTATTVTNPQISGSHEDQCCLPILHTQCWPRKQTSKRDRHSKIFTAQGPRDRRVRLSIDISRKFFGLQDLLGFDKASLTLDWLLTKSKTAIRELLQTKQIDNANVMCLRSLSDDGDFVTATTEEAANNIGDSKKTACSKRKRKTAKQNGAKTPKMTALDKLAKELRAKARERARERTREKNSLRNLCQEQKLPDLISLNPPNNQSRWTWSQIGTCKSTDSSRQSTLSSSNENSTPVEGFFFVNPRTGGANTEEMIQESVRIKRKTKPCSTFGFQRNLIFASKEANSDFNSWPSVTNDIL